MFCSWRARWCRISRCCRTSGRASAKSPESRKARIHILIWRWQFCSLMNQITEHFLPSADIWGLIKSVCWCNLVTELLKLCDVVRDDTLPELGVRLEDHEGNKAEKKKFNYSVLNVLFEKKNISFVCQDFVFMLITSVFCVCFNKMSSFWPPKCDWKHSKPSSHFVFVQ